MSGFLRLLRFAVFAIGGLLLVSALVVGVAITGRGTRPALGAAKLAYSDGLAIEYYDQGDGEVVVLLASLARSVSDFNELAEALVSAGYRTLAVESRGIGNSEGGGPLISFTLHELADDVVAVLIAGDVPKRDKVHLVGHAFGNRVARVFATDHPERTRSVALIAAGGRARIHPRIERALLLSTWSFLPWSLREPELRLGFFSGDNAIPDDWRQGWWYWSAMAQIAAARATPGEEFWAAGSAPLLVVQAADDEIAPPEDAGRPLLAEFPERVTLVNVPDAGHALLPEQPDRIEAAVLAFLAENTVR